MLIDAGKRNEVDVVDGHAAALARIAVDEIDQRIADALDRRDVELHRPRVRLDAPRSLLDQLAVSLRGILDAECHGADRRPMDAREALREAVLFGIDDEVDVTLAVQQHVLRAMLGDRAEAHLLEQLRRAPLDPAPHIRRTRSHRSEADCPRAKVQGRLPSMILPRVRFATSSAWIRQCYWRTILTPASFSCASSSDAMYLSPKPRRLALTML